MQTFLPSPYFSEAAKMLDMRRLGKQRVECKQIYLALTEPTYGWKNHPAVKMWKGSEGWLAHYGAAICREWLRRGYKDSLLPWFEARVQLNSTLPAWWYEDTAEALFASHRSNLLRKNPDWYKQFGWKEPTTLEYVWPI